MSDQVPPPPPPRAPAPPLLVTLTANEQTYVRMILGEAMERIWAMTMGDLTQYSRSEAMTVATAMARNVSDAVQQKLHSQRVALRTHRRQMLKTELEQTAVLKQLPGTRRRKRKDESPPPQ